MICETCYIKTRYMLNVISSMRDMQDREQRTSVKFWSTKWHG